MIYGVRVLEDRAAYMREYMRKWRAEHPERSREIAKQNRERNSKRNYDRRRAKLNALKDAPCTDCGVKYPPYVMQWDHRGDEPKEFTIGSYYIAFDRVLAEIA